MTDTNVYDAAIIGGGLAGLALSIQLARRGHSIILYEKEQYPFQGFLNTKHYWLYSIVCLRH